MIDLYIETKLRILNARPRGDLQGHLTYVGYHGCSTVDLVLTSEISLTKSTIVQYLSIQDLYFLSDHGPVLLKLEANVLPDLRITDSSKIILPVKEKPFRYNWNNSQEKEFSSQLAFETKNILTFSGKTDTNVNSKIEYELGEIQNAFIRSAKRILKTKVPQINKKKKPNHKKWFNLDCKKLGTNLQRFGRKVSQFPKNPFLREQFYKLKSKYRST